MRIMRILKIYALMRKTATACAHIRMCFGCGCLWAICVSVCLGVFAIASSLKNHIRPISIRTDSREGRFGMVLISEVFCGLVLCLMDLPPKASVSICVWLCFASPLFLDWGELCLVWPRRYRYQADAGAELQLLGYNRNYGSVRPHQAPVGA